VLSLWKLIEPGHRNRWDASSSASAFKAGRGCCRFVRLSSLLAQFIVSTFVPAGRGESGTFVADANCRAPSTQWEVVPLLDRLVGSDEETRRATRPQRKRQHPRPTISLAVTIISVSARIAGAHASFCPWNTRQAECVLSPSRAQVRFFRMDWWERFYRGLAVEARARAAQATNPSTKAALDEAAAEWSELADWVGRQQQKAAA
jgi:hypothetical protein